MANRQLYCLQREKGLYMSTTKNEKKTPFDKLSSQERQAIYNASPFFKKKNEDAIVFLKKYPIPKEFIKQL